jgi:predicted ester cyclase
VIGISAVSDIRSFIEASFIEAHDGTWYESVMDTAHNKAVVAQFDELGNRGGDLTVLDTLCTPDMVNHALAAGRPQGLEGTREFLRHARRDTHGGGWLNSIVVAEGDMVVQFGARELTWPGGSLLGFEAPPGTAARDVAFAYRLTDGRIAERWAIRDDLSTLVQLGALRR